MNHQNNYEYRSHTHCFDQQGTEPCYSCGGKGTYSQIHGEKGADDFGGEGYENKPAIHNYSCKACNGTGLKEKLPPCGLKGRHCCLCGIVENKYCKECQDFYWSAETSKTFYCKEMFCECHAPIVSKGEDKNCLYCKKEGICELHKNLKNLHEKIEDFREEKKCCDSLKITQVCNKETCDGVSFAHNIHCGICGEAISPKAEVSEYGKNCTKHSCLCMKNCNVIENTLDWNKDVSYVHKDELEIEIPDDSEFGEVSEWEKEFNEEFGDIDVVYPIINKKKQNGKSIKEFIARVRNQTLESIKTRYEEIDLTLKNKENWDSELSKFTIWLSSQGF